MDYTGRFSEDLNLPLYQHDLHRTRRPNLPVPAARDHPRLRRPADSPERPHLRRGPHQFRGGVGAGAGTVRHRRLHHDRREHLRLHRRQGRGRARAGERVRGLLGLRDRSLLRHRALHRAHLPVLAPRAHRLRDDHVARDDVLDHDELHARARRIAHRQVQGRLHGAPRTHRPLHDRRVHEPHGRGAVGDPGAVDLHGGRPHHSHVSRAAHDGPRGGRMKNPATLPGRVLWNAFFWTYERATWQYDLMVIAILAFVWLTTPDWLGDPTAHGSGPIGWLLDRLR